MRAGRRLDELEADHERLSNYVEHLESRLGETIAEAANAARLAAGERLEELVGGVESRVNATAKDAIDERSRAAQAHLTMRQDEVVSSARVVVDEAAALVGATRADVAAMQAEIEQIRVVLRSSLNLPLPAGA